MEPTAPRSRLRPAALLLCVLAALCLLSACSDLGEEERFLPGEWTMCQIVDLQTYEVTEAERFGFTLTLRQDRSGTLRIGENTMTLTWRYDRRTSDGKLRYTVELDGAQAYLYYLTEDSQLWLQNGVKTYVFEKR